MINVIKEFWLPEHGQKLKLVKPLTCYAKPPYNAYKPGKSEEIERQTGIVYVNRGTASPSPYWHNIWLTTLPKDIIITYGHLYSYTRINPPTMYFKIQKVDNPGWPLLKCWLEFKNFNELLVETV